MDMCRETISQYRTGWRKSILLWCGHPWSRDEKIIMI